jgi:hypothetical protein
MLAVNARRHYVSGSSVEESDAAFCFDAFSSRDPVAISFDAAMETCTRG